MSILALIILRRCWLCVTIVIFSLSWAQSTPPEAASTAAITAPESRFETLPIVTANPCERLLTDSLELADFGIARFGDFSFDSESDTARLFNGVCVTSLAAEGGVPLWQLSASELQVENISNENIRFDATDALVEVGQWRVATDTIRSLETGLELNGVTFTGPDAFGTARLASYDLLTASLSLEDIFAQNNRYRVQGQRARFEGGRVILEEAEASSCLCEPALYVVRAPEINFAPEAGRLLVRNGLLDILGLKIDLGAEFDPAQSFSEVSVPIDVSVVADDPAEADDTNGLVLRIPRLEFDDGMWLELGVGGLFNRSPVRSDALFIVRRPRLTMNFGYREGPRADFTYRVALPAGLIFDFGTEIKHWQEQEFLKDAFFGLSRRHVFTPADRHRFTFYGRGFMAASNQTFGRTLVSDLRLGSELDARYDFTTEMGTFSVLSRNVYTYYPVYDRFQYAYRLTPVWQLERGGLRVSLSYDRRVSNRQSPFSSSLDRFNEIERVNASVGINERLNERWVFRTSSSVSYDFRLSRDSLTRQMRSLITGTALEYRHQNLFVRPSFTLQTASLWNNLEDDDVEAFIEGDIFSSFDVYELGVNARVNLDPFGDEERLERLEIYGSAPFVLTSQVTVEPFVALDFAVTTRSGQLPQLSGHGLEVIWDGCCGALTLGYRQFRDTTTTSIGFNLDVP